MTLAVRGGEPVRRLPFPPRPQYGIAERNAANLVVASGNLSGFLAEAGDEFYGGPNVRLLEESFRERFDVEYAVAMNSATSCLFAAVQALGIGPGDEVIVTPWSMSASVACVVAAGATPVFADIEPRTFCLDPESVEGRVSSRTTAIVYVDLLGSVGKIREVRRLCDEYGLLLIEDAAQAIGARVGDSYAGTIGDVGVYSLNRHKVIQCGEGGVAITNDGEVAFRLQCCRNHGEVLGHRGSDTHMGSAWSLPSGFIGGNFRLGEIEAAIAEVQLGRLDNLVNARIRNAGRLTEALGTANAASAGELAPCVFRPPVIPDGRTNVFYLYATWVGRMYERDAVLAALRAEGVTAGAYVAPLYRLPAYKRYAPKEPLSGVETAYAKAIVHPLVHGGLTEDDVGDVIRAFEKVHQHRGELP